MESSNIQKVQASGVTLSYLSTGDSSDVKAGVYEGGFQLWECTRDLLQYMAEVEFAGKTVMDVGCGHGLLGIMAILKGAKSVTFQDFNPDVIKTVTIPNIEINTPPTEGKSLKERCHFLVGDWSNPQPYGSVGEDKFDILVGSQLIYNQANYQKLCGFLKRYLKQGGYCILANKLFYFGVGGNMASFREALTKHGLGCQLLKQVVPPKGGNKKQIVKVGFKQG